MDYNTFNFNSNKSSDKIEVTEEKEKVIDIFIKQRNGRKSITTIKGLGNNKDKLKLISKELSKKMSCNGSVKKDEENYIIKFSGKDVKTIKEYISKLTDYNDYLIKVHGTN